jgi:hypothetical protein
MTIVVEDGTGLANAESYVSVAETDAYHQSRGNVAWTNLTDPTVKEQYLRQATDYLGQRYALRWKGGRLNLSQALDWPRWNVRRSDYGSSYGYGYGSLFILDSRIIPPEVKKAAFELALRAIAGPLLPDLQEQVAKETVGPLTTEYIPGAKRTPTYGAIEGLLGPLLRANGGVGVVRG